MFEDNLPRRRKKTVLFGAEQKENESSEAKEKGDEVSEDKEAEAKISEKSEPIPIASPPNVESSPEVPLLSLVIPRAEDVDTKWSKVIEKNPIGDSQKVSLYAFCTLTWGRDIGNFLDLLALFYTY